MADKRTTPEAAAGASPRKRATPTIDLVATEVEQAAAGEPPAREQSALGPEVATGNEDPLPSDAPPEASNKSIADIKRPVLAGAAAGASVVTLVLIGLWLTGLLPMRDSGSAALRTADTQTIETLNGRIAKIEDTISRQPAGDAGVNDRVAAVENSMKALGLTLSALNRRGDDFAANVTAARERAEAAEKAVTELRSSVQIAATASAGLSSADLDVLQKRIAAMEQTAKVAAQTAAADMPARLALSAAALRDAVTSGAPFAVALAQVKSLGADEKTLAPLEAFAATGLPVPAALAQELRALLPAIAKQSGAQAPQGGFLEKLQANAGNLVRIRPVDAPPGDDTSAVLARIELEAARNDISGALGDLGKLPDAVRAPAQAWIAKANERQAALIAARAFAAEASRALGKP